MHPSPELIAAQVEQRLTGAERTLMLQHLEECSECRREVTLATRHLTTKRRVSWRRPLALVSTIAAGATFVLATRGVPASLGSSQTAAEARIQRIVLPETGDRLRIIAPADNATAPNATVRLTWAAQDANARYRVTLQDATGRVLGTWSTADTVVPVPDSLFTARESLYYWSVDAQGRDGRAITSKTHRFRR